MNEQAKAVEVSEEQHPVDGVVEAHAPRGTVWGWVAVAVVLAFTAGTFATFTGAL